MNFKENMIFELEKDNQFDNKNQFIKTITKKYGEIENIKDLFIKIQNYQIDKYGTTLNNFVKKLTYQEKKILYRRSYDRKKQRISGKTKRRGD